MAGIYLHIPFCKRKCSYCDFYSNTNFDISNELISAEAVELRLRRDYLNQEGIKSIYFGGGTPSVLGLNKVNLLLSSIYSNYEVNCDCEITFECNPDDLSGNYLDGLRNLGINRLSIGIQSFSDNVLKFLGRRHSAEQAKNAVLEAKMKGFDNISVDLIFGIPGSSFENYKQSLQEAVNLDVQHISAYQLTFEEKTLLYKLLVNNKIEEINEEDSIQQFNYTIKFLKDHGFCQYEVSNYTKDGFGSRHNSLYWTNGLYLGIGPAAHSYNGYSRQWNIANSKKYIKNVNEGFDFYSIENLTEGDLFNEYILTRFRTSEGVSFDYIKNYFNEKISSHFLREIDNFEKDSFVNKIEGNYKLTHKGLNILDFIVRKISYV